MSKSKKNENEALQKLQEQVQDLFDTDQYKYCDVECQVKQYGDEITVTVSKMYEHLPLTFDTLMKLSEIFGTKEFQVNQWGHGGCETCDYGSRYAHEFTYKAQK
jgi:hypothetical protein